MSASRDTNSDQFRKFAYTTIHHLQEPVRMVGVYAEMLKSAETENLLADVAEPLEFLQKAASQMQKLLQGLSDLTTVTLEKCLLKTHLPLDLPLRQAMLNLSSDIKRFDANISYRTLPSITGHSDHLQLLFWHLLQNAILYRGENRPQIVISATPVGPEWIVEIRDNGCGIAPEFQNNVFEPYARLHGKAIPGNGLGLAICRTIVENHGGRIWVKSDVGHGSSFFFTLPAGG
jgi:chemotaxis family two-component system sensor kinase Cph1